MRVVVKISFKKIEMIKFHNIKNINIQKTKLGYTIKLLINLKII